MILEEITEVEEDIGVLEITITTTLLERFAMDVAQAQDRNVIWTVPRWIYIRVVTPIGVVTPHIMEVECRVFPNIKLQI